MALTDGVVVTWTKSTGATGYQVYRDGVALGWLGDVATHNDTGAAAPTITAGSASASDGTYTAYVALSLSGQSANNGTTHTYKVRAKNATGESVDSGTNTGYRGIGSLTYQWQRSAADSDATYSNIDGATTASYNDTGAPADGSGRYYKCVENATGATQQISASNRGYRGVAPTVTTNAATLVEETTATGNGNVTAVGSGDPSDRQVEWGTSTGNYSGGYCSAGAGVTGAFSCNLTGLPQGTLIYARAKAYNSAGWGYGGEVTFLTKPENPTGLTASPGDTQVGLSWVKGTGANTTIIRGKIDSYPANYDTDFAVYSGTGVSTTHTGLTNGNHWYYRAWSESEGGAYTQYSDTYSQADATPASGIPSVTTNTTTDISTAGATLRGDLTSLGSYTQVYVYFEYGLTGGYGTSTSEQTRTSTGTFSQAIGGLSSNTTYHVRAVVRYDTSKSYGVDVTFQTGGLGAPTISTGEAVNVTGSEATLQGSLTYLGDYSFVQVYFQYGLTDTYGTNTLEQTKTVAGGFNQAITGLSAETLYHFRAAARYGVANYVYGADKTFTTTAAGPELPGLAIAVTEDATNVSATEATLKVTLSDDGGQPCTIWIAYGPDRGCSFHTGYAVGRISGQSYTEKVEELLPDTVYYYMAVAYKPAFEYVAAEVSYGSMKTFRTLSAGLAVPYSTTLPTVKVFRDAQQTGSRLIFARYNIDYTTEPKEPADAYYTFYLGDSAGNPLFIAKVISYGQGFAGLYLAPEHTFEWNSTAYTVVVAAKTGSLTEGVNKATRTLTVADYETDWKNIQPAVDDIMWYVERDKGVTYLSADGLNLAGIDYCEKALPGFEFVYPYPYVPSFTEREYEEGYATTLANRWDGTTYGTAIGNIADWTRLSSMWLKSICWLALLVIVGFIVIMTTQSAKPALLLSASMLIGGALLGFLPLVVTIVVGFVCILGIGYVFFYRSTA